VLFEHCAQVFQAAQLITKPTFNTCRNPIAGCVT
jgi:hypothetical protein